MPLQLLDSALRLGESCLDFLKMRLLGYDLPFEPENMAFMLAQTDAMNAQSIRGGLSPIVAKVHLF